MSTNASIGSSRSQVATRGRRTSPVGAERPAIRRIDHQQVAARQQRRQVVVEDDDVEAVGFDGQVALRGDAIQIDVRQQRQHFLQELVAVR